jgi:hypothetical protein
LWVRVVVPKSEGKHSKTNQNTPQKKREYKILLKSYTILLR